MRQDSSDSPMAPKQVETELADLTLHGQLPRPRELVRRGALLKLLHDALRLNVPTDQLARYRAAELLARLFKELALVARQRALVSEPVNPKVQGYDAACEVAAAGELFGLTDEQQLRERLARVGGAAIGNYERQYAEVSANKRGPKEARQVRAAVWLYDAGKKTRDQFSPSNASRHQSELMATFHGHLTSYIEGKAPALISELKDSGIAVPKLGAPSPPVESQRPPLRPTYIHRPELEAKFRYIVDSGAKLIALIGQPGMGKTWLAEAVAPGAPRIRFHSGEMKRQDFIAAFESREVSADILSNADPAVLLALLLNGNDAPPFVILDDLDCTDQIAPFLPAEPTKSVLVVTCRTKGNAFMDIGSVVRVGTMERKEAIRQVRGLLPNSDESDADLIANTFHDYPLVIAYACRAYKEQTSPLHVFCQELNAEAASEASDMYTQEGTSLLVVLRRLIKSLKRHDPLAYEQLICLSMSIDGGLSTQFLIRFLQAGADKLSDRRSFRALQQLANYSFIEESDSKGYPNSSIWRPVALHPFVREILNKEFKSKEVDVCRRALKVCLVDKSTCSSLYSRSSETVDIICNGQCIFYKREPAEPALASLYDQFDEIRYLSGFCWTYR